MKRFIYLLFLLTPLMTMIGVTSCGNDDDPMEQLPPNPDPEPSPDPNSPITGNKGNIKVNSTRFTVTFQDNATANAFKQMLPMTINMTELNHNEKYYSLPNSLPTNASNPGTIQNGDLMLYGSNTLVLFYKSFSTSYSYTRIGRVDNPSGLETVLGSSNISITFEMQQAYETGRKIGEQ